MSLVDTIASISSVSSMGTTSIRGSPGLATPPTVVSSTRLTTPRTGERISVRSTRVRMAGSAGCSSDSDAVTWLSSDSASRRKVERNATLCSSTSAIAASSRAIASLSVASWPLSSFSRRCSSSSDFIGSSCCSTSGSVIWSSRASRTRLLSRVAARERASRSSCWRWNSCLSSTRSSAWRLAVRPSNSASSTAITSGACALSSSPKDGAAPRTSAERRTTLARSA